MHLSELTKDFADALLAVDISGVAHKGFKPGIGPFGEADAVKAALAELKNRFPEKYHEAVTKRRPDLLIPGQWQVELKIVRPFGDNGKEAENWSQNVLHPYRGNTSSLGDCMKLSESNLSERKAIIVFGYEHTPPQITLETCIQGFEILATQLIALNLSPRLEEVRAPLRHPVHQMLRVYAWEILKAGARA